jgi:hypothetical protein
MVKPKQVETNKPPNMPASESSAYIVDLPADDDEAPLARSKFERTVEGLKRTFPKIREARATVKVSSPLGERRLFEVHALIRLPEGSSSSQRKGGPSRRRSTRFVAS